MLRIAIVGYGYWGPNVARNFASTPGARLAAVCDASPAAREKALEQHPGIATFVDSEELMRSSEIDAVAVVTPVSTHFEIARAALESGKHVFMEKPLTATSEQAERLVELAEKRGLMLMVDHTFLFTGAVRGIKQLVDDGELGNLLYFDSTRVNLGLFQHDVNVVWDLAPHDLSILDYLAKDAPYAVSAHGIAHFGHPHEDVAYITLHYRSDFIAHFSVNWLSPVKVRKTLIGGDKKMLVWDDLEPDEKIKVYDKGVSITTEDGARHRMVDYRAGDCYIPKIDRSEALKREAAYFVDCVKSGNQPVNDGRSGLRVVRLLEATQRSLASAGSMIDV